MRSSLELIVFHNKSGQKVFSPYQRLGNDPQLLDKLMSSINITQPSKTDVQRQMLMHEGESLLQSTLPVSDQVWVSIVMSSDVHSQSITRLLTPKLLIVSLCVLWLAIWGITCGLKKYSQQTISAARELRHRRMHDPLTGLRNRIGLDDVLQHRIDATDDNKHGFAVVLIDLVRFRYVNDTLGYELGDQLFVEVAERLKRISSEYHDIIRMSSDVFCVICPCDHDRADACRVANKIQDCIEAQKQLGDIH